MKMKYTGLKQKCLDEKYYEALKYMSHTLAGKDRTQFIKQICKFNIYLGAICATTCEYDRDLDRHIRYILNCYFNEKQVSYYHKNTGQIYTCTKVLGKYDIERFLLASYEIDNFKAIKWTVHNYMINENTLIKIAQKVTESEFVDLLNAISKSSNKDKMSMMCRMRSVPSQKNNEQAQKLLKYYWYEDRQIFTYLADSFGCLPDLDSDRKYGEMIYAKCFEEVDNSIAFNNVIINSINVNYREGLERLFRIINCYGSEEVKKNLYILFYMKLQNKFPIYKTDYKALEGVKTINKREVYLGNKTIGGITRENCSSWINVFDLLFYFPKRQEMSIFNKWKCMEITAYTEDATRNTYPLHIYLESYPDTSLKKIVNAYFNSDYVSTIYLDDFVMLITSLCNVAIPEICGTINEFCDVGKVFQRGSLSYFIHKCKTLGPPVTSDEVQFGEEYQIIYEDYDYIEHRFHVSVKKKDN